MVSIVEVTVAPMTMASSASRNDEPRRLRDRKRNRADIATRARRALPRLFPDSERIARSEGESLPDCQSTRRLESTKHLEGAELHDAPHGDDAARARGDQSRVHREG